MASRTQICNMAVSHIGVSKEIANVDTERSAEALACRRFIDHCIEEVMRDFSYPFATKYAALSLISSNPNEDWGYSYRYPSDCTNFLKILSGTRNDSRQSRVVYNIAHDESGRVIFTDRANALGKYTIKVTDTSMFTSDAVAMISLLLASYIAPRITAGDPFKMGERAYKLYVVSKEKAQVNAFNEQNDDENVDSEFIRDRE